jgi:hypothetical protein
MMKLPVALLLALPLALFYSVNAANAQKLDTRFSCSVTRDEDGERVIYADNGEMKIDHDRIAAFRWESALYRSTHGFDCSIDEGDGLKAEVRDEKDNTLWRVGLTDARAARAQRGFTFDRGMNCTIRLEKTGDTLTIWPSCPALCGSRTNFSALSVNMKTGTCRYEE